MAADFAAGGGTPCRSREACSSMRQATATSTSANAALKGRSGRRCASHKPNGLATAPDAAIRPAAL